ncbi:unnamed protein product [Durusdinium trenchii]|uniref:Uncharacterized protein n=1 Tax=Durusdinium trenchii TaxID=1381693 RepID=A0ABP0MPJ9_9DINO
MTITNFEMEPTPAPPVVKQVGVPLWMKLCMVALFLLAAFTIWRVEGTADERAEIQDQVMDLQSELRRLKKETAWSKEKKDLLVRAAQAEKGEKALNKELKRVHAELQRAYALQQGKDPPNISIPDLEEEEEEEIIEADKRPDEPPPYAYNSCQQEEHQVLCELIKDDNDAVIDKSRKCGRKALSLTTQREPVATSREVAPASRSFQERWNTASEQEALRTPVTGGTTTAWAAACRRERVARSVWWTSQRMPGSAWASC